MKWIAAIVACVVVLVSASPSWALGFSGSMIADGWNVTPFSGSWAPQAPKYATYWIEGDDTSPVNYPGVGAYPSPGYAHGRDGE